MKNSVNGGLTPVMSKCPIHRRNKNARMSKLRRQINGKMTQILRADDDLAGFQGIIRIGHQVSYVVVKPLTWFKKLTLRKVFEVTVAFIRKVRDRHGKWVPRGHHFNIELSKEDVAITVPA